MKIVCESCGAKYSIADEKVAGKVFKIRCKRCSEAIVVRGDRPTEDQPISPSRPAGSDEAVWHVVINGEQQGPYTPAQLADMLGAGTIDWEAFVWTEGFDNWVALRNVDPLVAKISNHTEAPPAEALQATTAAGGFGVQSAEDYAGEPSMGDDPFADEEGTPANTEEQDLFADASAAAVAPLTGGGASGNPRAASPEAKMTGARNENSVLFSLKNLQALATGTDDAVQTGAPGAGFASGEGSGLIDIRALASATAAQQAPVDNIDAHKDELLSLAGQGSAFGGLASPMMAPAPEESGGGSKSAIYASIIGAGVVVAAAVVAVGFLTRPDPQTAAALPVAPAMATTSAMPEQPMPNSGAAAVSGAEKAGPGEPSSEGELAARAAADQADGDEAEDESGAEHARDGLGPKRRRAEMIAKRKARKADGAGKPERPDSADVGSSAPASAAVAPARKSPANATIDDLLDGALGGKSGGAPKRKPAPAAAASNLPEKPSRDDVMQAMNAVKGPVAACGQGESGVAFANVTVAGDTGRVTNATIEGQTGAVGSCIARAVRKAKFPRFQASTFKVKFPFRL